MIEDPNKKDESLDATARDYLGKPSPLAFKNQPALPSGGGSIGVGAGPNTTAGGKGAGAVKTDAALAQYLSDLGYDPGGGSDGTAGGGSAGANAASGPESGVSGFDSTTVGAGLTAASLAMGAPGAVGLAGALAGAPGLATGLPGAATNAMGLGKIANSIMGALSPTSNMTMNTAEGPISVAPTYTGLFSALANALTGQSNFASVDPSTGQTMPSPYGGQSVIGSSLAGLSGPTGGLGQAGMHGPQGGFNAASPGAPGGAYGGYGGLSGDPSAPGAINFGQARGDNQGDPNAGPPGSPPGVGPPGQDDGGMGGVGSGAGGGGGGTFLCTALHKRGLLDDDTLEANHRFARTMTRAEYVGYAKWARPLAEWGDRHPRAALALYAVAGWAPRCYMAEIARPGSSLVGRVVLALGLRVCARLGAPRARRRLA